MDCLITKTHDHPWLKGHLPESLRKQRKLTKIESGLYHVGDIASHSLELLEISLLKEDDYLYNVASFPHIFLGGSKSDIDNLAQRIYYLSKSVLGLEFLNKLEKTKIDTLCVLEKFRDISQVILSYPKDAEPNFQISENLLPLEWVTEKNHEECARILEEIENGTGAVFIQKDHPQKEKILSVLRQLSMRPIGRLLLTRIDAFNKKNIIEIRYAKGLNIFQQGDINFVSLDLEHNHQSYSSLEKATERFVFIPNWCQSLVAHELIHALHCFLVKFEGELDLSLEKMINEAIFSESEQRYQVPWTSIRLYKNHSNYDEQRTILGVFGDPNPPCPITENSIRYEWFQPLRIEHKRAVTNVSRVFSSIKIIENNPLRLDSCTLDDLQIAVYKNDKSSGVLLLNQMNGSKIKNSLKNIIDKINQLTIEQRGALYFFVKNAINTKKVFSTFAFDYIGKFIFNCKKEEIDQVIDLLGQKFPKKLLMKHLAVLKTVNNFLAQNNFSPKSQYFFYRLLGRVCKLQQLVNV